MILDLRACPLNLVTCLERNNQAEIFKKLVIWLGHIKKPK